MRLLFAGVIVNLLFMARVQAGQCHSQVQAADRQKAGFEGARVITVPSGKTSLRWVVASWAGPGESQIRVVSVAGNKLAQIAPGHVVEARRGPAVLGIPTLEIEFEPSVGTNFRQTWVEIIQYRSHAIQTLWRHLAFDAISAPIAQVDQVKTYRWRYSGARIFVTGRSTIDTIHHRLPSEFYCFRVTRGRYFSCSLTASQRGHAITR